jgi:hypothetical protein
MSKRSEDSYIVHDIIPLLARIGYPGAGDHERVRIKDVPIYRPSGGVAGKMDLVYYHDGEPVLLVEAKRAGRSIEQACEEAENYLRNFPVKNKKYAPSGKSPRYFAITIGRDIKFYHHRVEVSDGQFAQVSEYIEYHLTFDELLDKYGLIKGYKPKILDAEGFRKEFLNELLAAYNISDDKIIRPDVIKNISWHILNYLVDQKKYVNRFPYTELDGHFSNQEYIKDLHKRFDLKNSITPEIADLFRNFILRSFQGTKLNQYLTERCVIAFMIDLISDLDTNWKIIDFECGSGGFLSAAAKKGVPMENMLGVDIDELPFIVAKTYLALYFRKTGKKDIEQIPIKHGNGLFYLGNEWDLVIGNPAGSTRYERGDLEEVLDNLERDIDQNSKDDIFSEYNFAIQQAVLSCKIGGKICLVLPEGYFTNEQDVILRKYIAKHCKVFAIISLPRGVFKKGTSTKQIKSGRQTASMKMSILYAQKIKPVIDGEGLEIDKNKLQYPVFMASISPPSSTAGEVCNWLEPRLNMVLEEWKNWSAKQQLLELDDSLIKEAYDLSKVTMKKKKDDKQDQLMFDERTVEKKPKTVTKEVKISEFLDDLFKK